MSRLRTIPAKSSLRNILSLWPSRRARLRKPSVCPQTASLTSSDKGGTCPPTHAIRLGKFFAVDPRFWLNLQAAYDLFRWPRTNMTIPACARARKRLRGE